jgi:hypothetical protein
MIDLTAPGEVERLLAECQTAALYKGGHVGGRAVVYADRRKLLPGRSQRVWNHSPDGFSWGYSGSGPAQLALALLLDAGLPDDVAVTLHQAFKSAYVARWDAQFNWVLRGTDLLEWIESALVVAARSLKQNGKEDKENA